MLPPNPRSKRRLVFGSGEPTVSSDASTVTTVSEALEKTLPSVHTSIRGLPDLLNIFCGVISAIPGSSMEAVSSLSLSTSEALKEMLTTVYPHWFSNVPSRVLLRHAFFASRRSQVELLAGSGDPKDWWCKVVLRELHERMWDCRKKVLAFGFVKPHDLTKYNTLCRSSGTYFECHWFSVDHCRGFFCKSCGNYSTVHKGQSTTVHQFCVCLHVKK